eukprot:GFUD01006215.1.p1 GENE.GFUD01006215.1~~GFUD01006215.1.p1  ORF type:complete len:265 (-),score=84.60 GFUD01006215.1:190-984(-)
MSFNGSPVQGVLCDITGVLAESSSESDGVVVPGSIEAINRLFEAGIKVKFVTNESARTRASLHAKLTRLGFTINIEDILTPSLAMVVLLKEQKLRPHLLVHKNVMEDFRGVETEDPNCVVLGDAVDEFSYVNLNTAFQVLLKSSSTQLFSLGKGKFYKEDSGLSLDVGPFTAALEFASERKAVICGKPDKTFFHAGLTALGLEAEKVVMVGDDIVSDVGGAQAAGIRGVQVRTGKFRPSDENHPLVKPDLIVDNLKGLVDTILK